MANKASTSTREYVNISLVGYLCYIKLKNPDEFKNRKSYQTTVFISDEQAKKLAEEYGITAAQDKAKAKELGVAAAFKGGYNLATRRYEERGAPKVTDLDGEDMSDARIGNGTKAIVKVTIGNDSEKQGKTLWLNDVVIKELVEWQAKGGVAGTSTDEDELDRLFA